MTKNSKFYSKEIKSLVGLQLISCAAYLAVLWLFDASQRTLIVALYGCALMTGNSFSIMWIARNILLKKLIALSLALVVFKTLIFMVLVYYFKANSGTESIAFMSGVAVATISLGLVGFRKKHGSF